jgi:hypothetical protein
MREAERHGLAPCGPGIALHQAQFQCDSSSRRRRIEIRKGHTFRGAWQQERSRVETNLA